MIRQLVSSSDFRSVGYQAGSETMEIEFNTGGVYQYSGIPQYVYSRFMTAPSPGIYFHVNIEKEDPAMRSC